VPQPVVHVLLRRHMDGQPPILAGRPRGTGQPTLPHLAAVARFTAGRSYGRVSWDELLDGLDREGPAELIRRLRAAGDAWSLHQQALAERGELEQGFWPADQTTTGAAGIAGAGRRLHGT
jgi:hypothetical protein